MAHKQVTKVINGRTYKIGTLSIGEGREVLVRLTKTLGPAVGEFFASVKSINLKNLGEVDASALGRAVQDFCLRLSSEDLDFVCQTFARASFLDNKPLETLFEAHFPGLWGEMLEWLGACIAHNYGDFTRLLTSGSAFRSALPAAPTPASE